MSSWGNDDDNASGYGKSKSNGKAVLPVLQKIDVAAIPFLKDFKTMPGKIVQSWMGQPKSFYPDCIDWLNGYVVPFLLLLCIGVNTATNFGWVGGGPMTCLVSGVR
ncbi:hypothetical protein AAVH_06825 [Aphelenchoides avenae]|nr:hypothetical protein AAVH_06825 [Aphelenchus avenae]